MTDDPDVDVGALDWEVPEFDHEDLCPDCGCELRDDEECEGAFYCPICESC